MASKEPGLFFVAPSRRPSTMTSVRCVAEFQAMLHGLGLWRVVDRVVWKFIVD